MGYVEKQTNDGKIVKLKDYKKRARRNKFRRKLLLVVFLLFVLILILLYAPFMQVKNINCFGNELVSAEEILSASKICKGNNIFRINKGKAIDGIDNFSYIKNVRIERKLPATINITVEECKLSAYILKGKEYVYLDEDGKVLEISQTPPTVNVPVVLGAKITDAYINDIIALKDTNQLEAYKKIQSAVAVSKFNGSVTVIDVTKINNTKITVNDSLEIVLGDAENLDYKINFMAEGAYNSLGSTRSGTLDVSHGSSATYKDK